MIQRIKDRLNHEYWPWWAIYLPVVPFYLWQALRSRRAAFFTNVNPAIDLAGFFGERKSAILSGLPAGSYPTTLVIGAHPTAQDPMALVLDSGIGLPLIVKPDVGERGDGVTLVSSEPELRKALTGRQGDLLVQALAPGEHEFGLFFARDPSSGRTTLLSITGKHFLSVTGDGRHTVAELLSRTHRGSRQLKRLRTYAGALLDSVPSAGRSVRVEPIGNHCRGTHFVDAGHLRTPALEQALERLMGATTGLYYGRMDVRCTDEDALRAGSFMLIEVNGVSSEPGHIYDPSWSIWRCWAELVRHVRYIGRISMQLQQQGVEPASLRDVLVRSREHFGWRFGPLAAPTGGRSHAPAHQASVMP